MPRQSILVLTSDVLGERMAGPAIRAFNIATVLSAEHDVTLVSTISCTIESEAFRCVHAVGSGLRPLVDGADIVVLQGFVTDRHPWLLRTDKILVADLYDPMHLEQMEQLKTRSVRERRGLLDLTVRVLNEQIVRCDFFLCASELQRSLWIGHLAAFGRVNPDTYDSDSSLSDLIAVCPFGLPSESPVRTRAAIKGVVPGISRDDLVILWAGGVYNWFDPPTLIRAVDRLRRDRDDVRLFFLGMKHPHPGVPEMRIATESRRLADALGLTGRFVFFNEGWVDYDDRQNYLLDADVGVSTHFVHLETTYSFRTRILDYLWAGLPVVATEGDAFAAMMATEGFGIAVPEKDEEALVRALSLVSTDEGRRASMSANAIRVGQQFTWTRALEPLLEYCRQPHRSADASADQRRIERHPVNARTLTARRLRRARMMVSDGRAGELLARTWQHSWRAVRNRISKPYSH